MEQKVIKLTLSNGSKYTTYELIDGDLFFQFIDIKGTKRWVNKTEVIEMNEVRNYDNKGNDTNDNKRCF